MGRTPIVGGNWKMNGDKASVEKLCSSLNGQGLPPKEAVDVVCFAPSVLLDLAVSKLNKSMYSVGAQNCYFEAKGAFTGEVSPQMIKDVGLSWVLVGHSERRAVFKESNEVCAKKLKAALDVGLSVTFCIGEQLEEREAGTTMDVCAAQLAACSGLLSEADWANVVVAYEPVWAIGTGKVATPEQAQETHKQVRAWFSSNVSPAVAEAIRIQYGGSVKPSNANDLSTQPDIDGFLVGGASLKAEDFAPIVCSFATAPELKAKCCLVIFDGWGVGEEGPGNAVANSATPNFDTLKKDGLSTTLDACGLPVGLPEGTMGNSEVGHLTIGAGRRECQDIVKINLAIKDGSFGSNPVLQQAFAAAKSGTGRLHMLGLCSTGGIHSTIGHPLAIMNEAKAAGVAECFMHACSDGRDTAPDSGTGFVQQVLDHCKEIGYGKLATVVGRYYAMDRDKRWDRVHLACDALFDEGSRPEVAVVSDVVKAMKAKYAETPKGITDEFMSPLICAADSRFKAGDVLVLFNYRADRMREIAEVLHFGPTGQAADGSDWPPFKLTSGNPMPQLQIFQMTLYKGNFPMPVLFPKVSLENGISEWLAKKMVPQFHVAETEKYAHVTYFFAGGKEVQFAGEVREMVPSPSVPTYDATPEMNNAGVTSKLTDAMDSGKYGFVVCNYAAPDMVGHTGVYEKACVAAGSTDGCLGQLMESCKKNGYFMMVTADHGNFETMMTPEGKPHTQHTTNPVDLITWNAPAGAKLASSEKGDLTDVAPTLLKLMGLELPAEMTGKCLVEA